MLDKKQIQAIFIPKFKTGDKVVETTCNINNAFGPESANKCTVLQEVLQKRWEPWRWGAQWLVFGSCQWPIERIIKADLQVYMRSCQELNVDHFKIIQHLKQIRKVKKLSKWVPHEQTKSFKKTIILKCHLLLLYTTTNHFAIALWCATKSGFYMTISEDQFSGWTKEKLQSTYQSQTCTQKMS